MAKSNNWEPSYESVAWVYGTTSLRPAHLRLKIEKQLFLLDSLRKSWEFNGLEWTWQGNEVLQEEYYDLARDSEVVKGNAKRKAKDARVLSSGLVDLGLITNNRELTEVGLELINRVKSEDTKSDNLFFIGEDSFIYLKQLLKVSIRVGKQEVRPFIILLKLLKDLEYLTQDEFKYLLPLITTREDYKMVVSQLNEIRKSETRESKESFYHEAIWRVIISKKEYLKAWSIFEEAPEDKLEDIVPEIALNRKSKSYSKVYYYIYELLKRIYVEQEEGNEAIIKLYDILNGSNGKPFKMWKNVLFESGSTKYLVRQKGIEMLRLSDNPFYSKMKEKELREIFFMLLHVFKTKATLEDYSDLNTRYIKLADIILFDDEMVCLDTIPKEYFNGIVADTLFDEEAFSPHELLRKSVDLELINEVLNEKVAKKTVATIQEKFNIRDSGYGVRDIIRQERIERFKTLIEERFSNKEIVRLIKLIEERNDERVYKKVTDDADIPTIFEYIVAIAWYRISEYKGDILSFMKLSLDSSLLPRTHASGGTADIVYEYYQSDNRGYPDHTLLIEVTLTEESTQRRAEMEPVSRHLGDYIIENNAIINKDENGEVSLESQTAQALFVATHLHTNTSNDFYARRFTQYSKNNYTLKLNGTKIIGIDTKVLTKIISKNLKYSQLYPMFQDFFNDTSMFNAAPYNKFISAIESYKGKPDFIDKDLA